jgi:hypothetical protein
MLGPDRPRFVGNPASVPPVPADSAGALSPAQWAAVRRFVAQVGGLENAHSAMELLAILASVADADRNGADFSSS